MEKRSADNDREFFLKIGRTATDKFYINEDERKYRQQSMKGGSRGQAEEIKERFKT